MLGKTKKEIKITLTLNEDEARWLKGLIQNPLQDDEPKEWVKYRKDLWEALSEIKEI